MNKTSHTKIIFCTIVLTFALWHSWSEAQPAQPAQPAKPVSEESAAIDIGRDNPFGKIVQKKKAAPKNTTPKSQLIAAEQLIEVTPDLFVETITLKFLDAQNLRSAISGMCSGYGRISTDTKSNSLIICDTEESLKKILTEIRRADKTPKQIMVEVVILDVKIEDDTKIGVDWDSLFLKAKRDFTFVQNLVTTATTGGLGLNLSILKNDISGTIHLLQETSDVEILASPRVMMVSGESAYIEAIEEIPYQEVSDTATGGAAALPSTVFKEVGVKLTVSALLVDSNDIFLTVKAEQNVQTGTSDAGVPIVDTRKANTSLLLGDGQVVVLGGLRRQEKTVDVDKIPILGDLPLIGGLFRNTKTDIRNTELLVFLSPHIHKGEPIPDSQMAKYNEIRSKPLLAIPNGKKEK